jgi:hypothetical protein
MKRGARVIAFPLPVRWMAAAAAALVAVLVIQSVVSRPLTAAELLQKAVVAQKQRPADAARARKVRVTGRGQARAAQLFAAAHYRWNDSLDPAAFAEWRDSLPHKEDRVLELPDKSYQITTSTSDSVLEEASITLHGDDFHAVQGTFRFRGNEYLEVTEEDGLLPSPAAGTPDTPKVASGSHAAAPASPVGAPASITPSDELRVVAAIHAIRADLGDPVEITRDDERGRIVVRALGADADRQQQLRAQLGSFGNVELRFEEPDAVRPGRPFAAAPRPAEPSKPTPLQERLAAQLGGHTTAENFTNHVLDLSDASVARAHALRALARRFPPAVEAQLAPADLAVLHRIEDDHTRALLASVRQMVDVIRPVVKVGAAVPEEDYPSWQAGAESVLTAALTVDGVLTKALATREPAVDPDDALNRLGRSASDLQMRVAALRTTVARAGK